MATIASLDVALGVNSAKLKQGLTDAEKRTKQFADKSSKHAKGMAIAFKGVATALAGIIAVASVKALAANADAMIKAADGAGIAFGAFQKLQFGLEQAGLSSGSLQGAMIKMNKAINEAGKGTKTAVDELSQIGLTFKDLNKMKPEDRFRAIVDGLNGIEDKGKRSALAMKLLGKEFADKNISMEGLDKSSEGLVEIKESIARASEAFNDSMNLVQTNFKNIATNIIGTFLPYLTSAFDALAKFSKENPTMISIVYGLMGVAVAAGTVATAVAVMGGPVTIAIGAIAAAIAGLVVVVNNWDDIMKTVTEFLADVFGVEVETVTGFIERFSNWISTAADWLKGVFLDGLNLVTDGIRTALSVWLTLFDAVTDLFTLDFAGFSTKMIDAFTKVGNFFSEHFGNIIGHLTRELDKQFTWAFKSVADAFSNAINASITWILQKLYTGLNAAIALYNAMGGSAERLVYEGGGVANTAGARPVWSPFAGQNTGTGLTSAIMPPAAYNPLQLGIGDDDGGGGGSGGGSGGSGGGGKGGGGGKSAAVKAAEKENAELEKLRKKQTEDALREAESFSDNILNGMAAGFAHGLKTGNWKEAMHGWLDQITNQIIDNFSQNLMDALFGDVFKNIFENFGKSVEAGMAEALNGAGGGGGIISFIGSLFGGGGAKMATGGIVPHTPYSKLGQDSVPTMLTPGELVVPVGEVANFQNGGGGGVVNINFTGDISRQTKTEIYKMMPDLAKAINEANLEAGYK